MKGRMGRESERGVKYLKQKPRNAWRRRGNLKVVLCGKFCLCPFSFRLHVNLPPCNHLCHLFLFFLPSIFFHINSLHTFQIYVFKYFFFFFFSYTLFSHLTTNKRINIVKSQLLCVHILLITLFFCLPYKNVKTN